MAVYLTPRNRPLGQFRIGSWSWGYLLDLAGPVIPGLWTSGGRWWRTSGVNPRFKNPAYPEVLGDSGQRFSVKASEARQLANVARNWARIQQTLPEANRLDAGRPYWDRPFPEKVRDDWPPLFLAFADWAEQSAGFTK